MVMRLYDTARQAVVPFEPGPVVTMYTCGITPYDATHLGHAATYLAYDVLQRRLRDLGHETRCVRNITDVDDSLLGKARELGVHYLDLAAAETARFDDDMGPSGLLPAVERAPRHLGHPRHPRLHRHGARPRSRLPGRRRGLLRRVHRRRLRVGVATTPRPDARLRPRARRQRRRPEQARPARLRALAAVGPDEPAWETLWGPGRPGWHIECSALALRELGTTIDLHGGGSDLIFPHHECERAQSEAATGEPFVRHWMHQAMVRMDGEKMSKSSATWCSSTSSARSGTRASSGSASS
jgi:L-cysteine:1D-myo-inositol 2-amino-2-deoxy-alpha-D-glucopyranoside ligase